MPVDYFVREQRVYKNIPIPKTHINKKIFGHSWDKNNICPSDDFD